MILLHYNILNVYVKQKSTHYLHFFKFKIFGTEGMFDYLTRTLRNIATKLCYSNGERNTKGMHKTGKLWKMDEQEQLTRNGR